MEISEMLMYLLKVISIQGVFFFLYHVFMRKKTSYSLNRYYLLFTLVTAFFIPLVELPLSEDVIPDMNHPEIFYLAEKPVEIVESNPLVKDPEPIETSSFDWWLLVGVACILLSSALIVRSIFHLIILQKLKKQSVYVEKRWFKLFKTSQVHPFSFLTNVFIPGKVFGTSSFDQILEHECEHVRQYHSLDRLLIDFMAALLWFNPFIYLYRRALIEIHEYQADEAVLRKFSDPIGYQEILFSQLSSAPYSGLVSHFNFSTIKKRIVMINKNKNKRSLWAYILAVPVTLFVVLAFANKVPSDHIGLDSLDESHEMVDTDTHSHPELETHDEVEGHGSPEQEDRFTPSILPLKETDKMKVTSSFGMRMDPFDKKKKMHYGLDLATPIGTTVVATADGEIHQAGYHDKYGYFVLIDHGDKYMTRYSQLSSHSVNRGDEVEKGQKVGLSGSSGRSTAPHLHYEVIETGKGHKNPMMFIKNHKFKIKEVKPPLPPKTTENDEEEKEKLREEERRLAMRAKQLAEEERVIAEEKAKVAEEERAALAEELQIRELKLLERLKWEEEKLSQFDIKRITDNPLYILDGRIIEKSEVLELDTENIQHVEVMKGKGALEKYGEAASGGVIIIDSKKGKVKDKDKDKSKTKVGKKDKKVDKQALIETQREILQKNQKRSRPFRVAINPSHGGNDTGAISPSGKMEKDISLAIAKKIASIFGKSETIEIVLIRDSDVQMDLNERLDRVDGADLLVSLHMDNYSVENESFVVPIYNDRNEYSGESERTAHLIADEFEKYGKEAKVGYSTGYYILKNADCPAVMVSIGFFSKPEEDVYLSSLSGQQEVAERISSAIKLAVL